MLPNVNIHLGNGGLGRVAASADGVAGLILTGTAVQGQLELNKHYQLSSTRDLKEIGVTSVNNPLVSKEVGAFYAQAGEGAELHLMVVGEATTLTEMCSPAADSPLHQLIDAAGGRIRIVGVNKLPGADYEADVSQGIDADAIGAAANAQQVAESYASQIRPFRVLLAAPAWTGSTESLYKPSEASYDRVAFVLASDEALGGVYTAAVGMTLGRAAAIEPQQCIARVKSGSLAENGYFTSGDPYLTKAGMAEALNDAGYIFFISLPAKNGCYLNGDPMAVAVSDDYAQLNLGRIVDKAMVIAYSTYISEILENIVLDSKGQLSTGVCKSFEGMIENAINSEMGNQISEFSAYVDPAQNILSTGRLTVDCRLVPQGIIRVINVNLSFSNPAL